MILITDHFYIFKQEEAVAVPAHKPPTIGNIFNQFTKMKVIRDFYIPLIHGASGHLRLVPDYPLTYACMSR